jgi:hypothetical protein
MFDFSKKPILFTLLLNANTGEPLYRP